MANTFKKIQTITVGSGGAANIEFTSIPATYSDLKIVLSARSLQGNVYGGGALQFNSDTGSNYKWYRLRADGSTTASDSSTSATAITNWDVAGANATASVFGSIEIYIPNYAGANQKSVSVEYVGENNATESHMGMVAGLWTSTAAITSIKLYSAGGNLVQYTTATLYGVSNLPASEGGAKATGGVITADSSYFYHTFTFSGTFTPTQSLTCDYLVVAGGGGGAANTASNQSGGVGGGGGGGFRTGTLSLSATSHTVTVGAGGAGSSTSGTSGSNGSTSVFSTINTTGGGGGAGTISLTGSSGGSGGGAYGFPLNTYNGGAGNAGSYSPVEGYAGARGYTDGSSYTTGGGGGGAGAAATQKTSNSGGDGGAGATSSISGTSTTYAGGGGGGGSGSAGGTGGSGGGGAGSVIGANATSGTAFTGGGGGGVGGGSVAVFTGGSGGSGIVIVRYAR